MLHRRISGESNSILNTAIHIGASEQSSQKHSLKGKGLGFHLMLQVCHSHRNLEVLPGFPPMLDRKILASNSDNLGSSDSWP
jgi:hypothetical protein